MRLASVRSLKQELSGDSALIGALASGPGPRARARAAPQARVALGVAPGDRKGDFKLAVRIQGGGDGTRGRSVAAAVGEHYRDRASGEADVRVVRDIAKRSLWYQQRQRPLTIGSSVAHFKVTAGTIGAFVEPRQGSGIFILSNNHVLANEGRCAEGDLVLQHAPYDGGVDPDERVAVLKRWTQLSRRGRHYVDGAIAHVEDGLKYYPYYLRGGRTALTGVFNDLLEPDHKVWKIGRTTGLTRGRVTAIELDDVGVEFDMGVVTFDNQIEIEGNDGLFSDSGDSGSLIVDTAGKACGLLFAGGREPGRNGRDLTYANPINDVLSALRIKLAT